MIPNDILIQADTAEGVWLDKVYVCQRDEATAADIDNISWSAHFANLQVFLAHGGRHIEMAVLAETLDSCGARTRQDAE